MSTGTPAEGTGVDDSVFLAALNDLTIEDWPAEGIGVAPVHSTDAAALAVQVITAGGHLQAHHHEGTWDYFVGLRGSASLQLTTTSGIRTTHQLVAGSFLAVPPGVIHRVDNTDGTEPFVYLLTQTPNPHGDFHEDEDHDEPTGGTS